MQEAWREIFSNKNQNVLVELLVHDYFSALKFLFDQQQLEREVYEEQLKEIQAVRGKDLTVAFKLLGTRFLRVLGERPASLRINMQGFFFNQKALGADRVKLEAIEDHSSRLRTTDPIFTFLKEARNLNAHNLSQQPSHWNILVLASVQHLLNISRVQKQFLEDARDLMAFICDELGQSESKLKQDPPTPPAVNIEGAGQTAALVEELRAIKGLLEVTGASGHETELSKTREAISEAEFESALVELRSRVLDVFAGDDWPGPMANLFQKTFVSEVLKFKPKNLAEAMRLPDVAWRFDQNRNLIKRQVSEFGAEFDALISSVKWEDEDDIF